MQTLSSGVPVLVAGACLCLAACADQQALLAPEPPSARAAIAAQSLPRGTYAMTLQPEDFPPFIPSEVVQFLTGDWELDLNEPQRYVVRLGGHTVVTGRATANPARFVIDAGEGPLACPVGPLGQGVYGWAFDGLDLVLSAVQEKCDGRLLVLTVKPWQKQ